MNFINLLLLCLSLRAVVGQQRACTSTTCKYGATCSVVNGYAKCSCAGRVCPAHYDPVCGSDGATYPNSCFMGIKTCESQGDVVQVSTGECPALTCASVLCAVGSVCRENNGRPTCECISGCPKNLDPRCGTDGVTYGNECLMQQKTCESRGQVTEAHVGACRNTQTSPCAVTLCRFGAFCREVNGRAVCECGDACTLELDPRCGSDGVTYSNGCVMLQKTCRTNGNVTELHRGACPTSPSSCAAVTCPFGSNCQVRNGRAVCECIEACTKEHNPVCGSDGVTYSNPCFIAQKSCQTQGAVTQVHTGACVASPPSSASCAAVTCPVGSTCKVKNNRAVCECIEACTKEHNPVCGSDGVTYSNPCLMAQKTCQTQGAVTQVRTGACVASPPSAASCAAVTCPFGSNCKVKNNRAVCECIEACTEEYRPVCGSDGVTYPNPCFLAQKSCQTQGQITQDGEGECAPVLPVQCQTIRCGWGATCKVVNGQATCQCPTICTREFNPVCGTDNRTYGNPCEMNAKYCESRGQVEQAYQGECRRSREEACSVSDWASNLPQWSYKKKTVFKEAFNTNINGNPSLKEIIQSNDNSLTARFLRQAVAALLNAAADWNYRYESSEVVSMVQRALWNSKQNETLELFKAANSVGNCPLYN